MRELLPIELSADLQARQKIVVLSGDITVENFGIDSITLDTMRNGVSIFIHAASSISLRDGLPKMASSVVHPSLAAAKLALSFTKLKNFTFVSTAYVNGFLHWQFLQDCKRTECVVEERVYPLRKSHNDKGPSAELANIVEFGTTPEHSCIDHPYAYSYVKHLTERLLLGVFQAAGCEHKLLLFRPSCFAPAQQEPFPHFEVPGSVPVTTAMCATIASRPGKARCTSNLADPSTSTIDEVPVDVVVNRLLVHIAFSSSGCVHAVSGASGRRSFTDMYNATAKLRRRWWLRPTISWCEDGTDPSQICALSKFYKILGCSYWFREDKTEKLWELMDSSMREKWPLWSERDPADMSDFAIRARTCKKMLSDGLAKRYGRPGRLMAMLVGPRTENKTPPTEVKASTDEE